MRTIFMSLESFPSWGLYEGQCLDAEINHFIKLNFFFMAEATFSCGDFRIPNSSPSETTLSGINPVVGSNSHDNNIQINIKCQLLYQ